MIKSKLDVVQWGTDRLRIGPWRGDARTAFLAPVAGRPTSAGTVERCLDVLAATGYESVLTAALSHSEQQPFVELGFVVHERLHLLRHDLRALPGTRRARSSPAAAARPRWLRPGPAAAGCPRWLRIRRARPFDQRRVLDLDGRAFDHFWRFDRAGLADARRATPSSRFRVAEHADVPGRATVAGARPALVGYAITGRAADIGYLQRLAVDPDHHHRGIGSALVADSLRWARRHGATAVLVNTQETNVQAQSLYQRLGFTYEEHGLAVLERSLLERWP